MSGHDKKKWLVFGRKPKGMQAGSSPKISSPSRTNKGASLLTKKNRKPSTSSWQKYMSKGKKPESRGLIGGMGDPDRWND